MYLIAQLFKNPPAMQETQAQFLGQEGLLEKGQATHSSMLGFPWWVRQLHDGLRLQHMNSLVAQSVKNLPAV